jgi:hypothetical protein
VGFLKFFSKLEEINNSSYWPSADVKLMSNELMHENALDWGARKLTGENLKLVWAEFSTLS